MLPRLTPTPLPPVAPGVGEPVSLGDVLARATRRMRRSFAPGLRVRHALTWEAADRHDPQWWPQGITSSTDAGPAPTGRPGTSRSPGLLLVSWYAKNGQGVRITFLDRATRRYLHVLLALPADDGTLSPLRVHAGGIVWRGPWLYVASTKRGCYVAHLDDLRRTPEGELVWPVRMMYAAEDGMRYSFISATSAATSAAAAPADAPGALLAGEYGGPTATHRLARFAFAPSGLLRLDADGQATAVGLDHGVPSMQGAAWADGRYLLMVSRGRRRPGDLWDGRAGRLRRHSFAAPPGPEDVSWDGRLLWSVTEFPGRRWVFALRPPRNRR